MKLRRITLFWLPLFASMLLMTSEGPIISAAINRLPNEAVMLAALGIVYSLSVFIESPIINMLATGAALVKDRQSYQVVQQFTIFWMVALTIITVLVSFTPLFDLVVVEWMNTAPDVAHWVKIGMQIMTLWSAAIAWRRFLQGVLIGYDQTRQVAWGTVARIVTSGGVAVGLALFGNLPGIVLGTIGLMAGVIAEALYATWASRPLLKNELSWAQMPASTPNPLTFGELFKFHMPLAGTSVLALLAQPVGIFFLNRLPNPDITLAAWPLVFQLMLMMRAAGFALPETVITLSKEPDSFEPLRRFGWLVTFASFLILAAIALTPIADLYLFGVQDATQAVGAEAKRGLVWFLFMPAFNALVSWLRGLLISRRDTRIVNVGMGINLLAMLAVLIVGLTLQQPGIPTGAVSLTIALFVETLYLWRQVARQYALPLFKPAIA